MELSKNFGSKKKMMPSAAQISTRFESDMDPLKFWQDLTVYPCEELLPEPSRKSSAKLEHIADAPGAQLRSSARRSAQRRASSRRPQCAPHANDAC